MNPHRFNEREISLKIKKMKKEEIIATIALTCLYFLNAMIKKRRQRREQKEIINEIRYGGQTTPLKNREDESI